MSIKINYSNKTGNGNSTNLVIFSNDKFSSNVLKKYLLKNEINYINELLKTNDLKKNLFVYELSSKKKIILISIKKDLKTSDIENLGAELYGRINYGKNTEYSIISESIISKHDNFLGHFLHGLKLKSYEFGKYKTKNDTRLISINVRGNKNKPSVQKITNFKAIEEGTFYARDLVSEPGNILHPDEYAKRLNLLKKDGLKVSIYDEKKLKKLGMHALLGVGQGSIRGSYLVTLEWNGAKNKSKPLALLEKEFALILEDIL